METSRSSGLDAAAWSENVRDNKELNRFEKSLPLLDILFLFHSNIQSSAIFTDNLTDVSNVLSIITRTAEIVGWFELSFAILGPPMQLLVMFMGTNVYRRTGQTSQLVVLSMTCGDLLVSSIHSPMMFGYFGLSHSYSFFPCALMYLMTYIGCIASSLSLLLLNVDKFIYLSKPLHYHLMVTARRIVICIAFIWAITLSWAVLIIFGPATNFMSQGECVMVPKHWWVYIAFLFVFMILPIMISLAISLYIMYLVSRHQQARDGGLTVQGAVGGLVLAVIRLNDSGTPAQKQSRRSDLVASLRSILFVFSATIWTFCTVLPYRIGYILYDNEQYTGVILALVLFILLSLNPVGNPIIIMSTQRSYILFIRKNAKKWFGKKL